jgi:hypothetical protein
MFERSAASRLAGMALHSIPGKILRLRRVRLRSGLLAITLTGCCQHAPPAAQPPTTRFIADAVKSGLTTPVADQNLKAMICPPAGWKPDPPKITSNHYHQTWISPTGDTAYGIIYFSMPLPFGVDTVLWKFMQEMKNTEGEATLLEKQTDDKLPGLRFVAEGGLYRIRCNLSVAGFHGWVVYAGTLRSRPVNQRELDLAEKAREQTRVNLQ